jgi:cell division protein FtsA
MIQDDYRAAIDVGTTKVCTILGRARSDGSIEIAGIGVAPCVGLKRGLVVDPTATTRAVRQSLQAASNNAAVPIRRAYLGLTGRHIESRNIWSKVDSPRGISVVTESDLRRALAVASADASTGGSDVLHVIPRSYALDGIEGVRNPLGMHAGDMYVQIHAILGARHPIRSLKASVEAAGVKVAGLVVEPVGAAEAVLTEGEREDGVILIDIGGGTTDMAVFHNGSIIHTAVLDLGGYQFSNDIAYSFDCALDEAEAVKVAHGSISPNVKTLSEEFEVHARSLEDPYVVTRRELAQLMQERATELIHLVRGKLDVPHLEDLKISKIVLTGGGAKLDGIQDLFRHYFKVQVRTAVPRGADGLPEEQSDPKYSASVGILLWGMRNLARENHISESRSEGRSAAIATAPGIAASVKGLLPGWRPGKRRGTSVGV